MPDQNRDENHPAVEHSEDDYVNRESKRPKGFKRAI